MDAIRGYKLNNLSDNKRMQLTDKNYNDTHDWVGMMIQRELCKMGTYRQIVCTKKFLLKNKTPKIL